MTRKFPLISFHIDSSLDHPIGGDSSITLGTSQIRSHVGCYELRLVSVHVPFMTSQILYSPIDLIAIVSARKAKSRAQLTTMRTTVAYTRTKHCFMLDYHSIANAFH